VSSQTRLRLTDEQMMHICTGAIENWVDGIVFTFECFGIDLTAVDCPSIKPSDYAIPSIQWRAIADSMVKPGVTDHVALANHALDWMNLGPSAYEEDA